MKTFARPISLLSIFLFFVSPCLGQYLGNSPPGTITGSGKATLKAMPERMRLSINLSSRGDDIDKALTALQDRIDASKIQLKTLGAIEDSIQSTSPKIDTQKSAQHEQMRSQLMESLGRAGRSDDQAGVNTMVMLSSSLSAEWDLSGLSNKELLVKTFKLQKQVRDAKLAGDDTGAELSAEEQELLEEAQMFGRYSSRMEEEGGPEFFFYSKIKKVDYENALKSAVASSRKQAEKLAAAAGLKLGPLEGLRMEEDFEYGFEYAGYGYGGRSNLQGLSKFQEQQADRDVPLAVGIEAGELTLTIEVSAGFGVEE